MITPGRRQPDWTEEIEPKGVTADLSGFAGLLRLVRLCRVGQMLKRPNDRLPPKSRESAQSLARRAAVTSANRKSPIENRQFPSPTAGQFGAI